MKSWFRVTLVFGIVLGLGFVFIIQSANALNDDGEQAEKNWKAVSLALEIYPLAP